MVAIHDTFTARMRNRLKTTGMGLGLVRLLQDAGRTEEARTTLCSLESGFQSVAVESGTRFRHGAKDRTWVNRKWATWVAGMSPTLRLMLAASAILLFAAGVTIADDRRYELGQVEMKGTFVKFDADKNEITIKVNGKDKMTFRVLQDGKVAVGEVKDLKKLKADDDVILTLMRDGDKNMVIEVRQGKQQGLPSLGASEI
jgi:hypothetical protein